MAEVKIDVKVITSAAQAAVKALETQTKATTKGFESLNQSVQKIGNTFKSALSADLVGSAIRKIANSMLDLAKSSIQVQENLEKATARFTAFAGSAEVAAQFVKELDEISDSSPFEFEQVADAAQKLLTFGRSANQVKEDIKVLGDVATASGAQIEDLSNIFGKAAAVGQVTSRELSALQSNSIPIVQALSEQLGVSGAAVKKLANDGKIDFKTFEEAFKSLSKEGGFAFGAMERQSQTLTGRIKSVKDAFEEVQKTVGAALTPAIKALLIAVTQLINQFNFLFQSTNNASNAGQTLITVISFLAKAAVILYNSFNGIIFVLEGLVGSALKVVSVLLYLATGPLRLVLNGLSAFGSVIGLNTEALDKFDQGIASLSANVSELGSTFLEGADQTATAMTANSQAIDDFTKSLQTNFDKEIELSNKSKDNKKKNSDFNKKIKSDETIALEEELRKQLEVENKFQTEKQILMDEIAVQAEQAKLTEDGLRSEQDELDLLILKDKLAKERAAEEEARALKLGDMKAYTLLVLKNDLDQAKRSNDIKDAQLKLDKERRSALINGTISLFGALASLAATGGAKLFKIAKAFNIAEAISAGIVAVQRAYSNPPGPPYTIPAAIAAGVQATANVIRIKQTEPSFEDGGIVGGSSIRGDNIKARVNSGEMILNRQQQAQLFSMANGSSSGNVIQVNSTVVLDGEVVGRAVSRQVADGLKLGEVF